MKEVELLNKRFNPYDLNDVARVDTFIKSNQEKSSNQTTTTVNNRNKPPNGFFHIETEKKITKKK